MNFIRIEKWETPVRFKMEKAFVKSFFTTMPWWLRRTIVCYVGKSLWSTTKGIGMSLIAWWLTVATFGRWNMLGELIESQREDIGYLSERIEIADQTQWRLDELMRFLEYRQDMIIPSSIEPPRLTSGASGQITEEMLRDGGEESQAGIFEVPQPPTSP